MIFTNQTGAVRCCSYDGGSCESRIPKCNPLKTFSNAKQECSEFGMRLCSEEELASNICCTTGCDFDLELVWYTKGNLFRSTEFNRSSPFSLYSQFYIQLVNMPHFGTGMFGPFWQSGQ